MDNTTYGKKEMVEYYSKLAKSYGLLKSERTLIEKYFHKEVKILDIGCGAGRVSIGLYNLGYKNIFGIDISSNIINEAKKNNNYINFDVADVTHLPFNDYQFDGAIFSFNGICLIEGIKSRQQAMSEIYRVLKSEGIAILTTPFVDDKLRTEFWTEHLKDKNKNEFESYDISIDEFNIENIYMNIAPKELVEKLIQSSGFKVVECVRRLDIAVENEEFENELDDGLYWIVSK